jgi:SpoVK/Ycf46/Vps4 family AAA+-type ATPase
MHLPPLYVHLALPFTGPETPFHTSDGYCLEQTSGCSGAEITAMCQEAALITMREDINATFVRDYFLRGALISISENSVGPTGRVRRRCKNPQATDHTRDAAKV